MRFSFGVLLAPIAPFLFWMWQISAGHISTQGMFGHGLAVAGVMLAAALYAASLVILFPVVLILSGYGRLTFWWVVGTITLIGMAWKIPLELYYSGLRRAAGGVLGYSQREFLLEGGAYAFFLAVAFCLIAGIPFRRKSKEAP